MAPYRFRGLDLHPQRIGAGIEHTLYEFYRWRDRNGPRILAHADMFTEQVRRARVGGREHSSHQNRVKREVAYFAVFNLAEVMPPDKVAYLAGRVDDLRGQAPEGMLARIRRDGVRGVVNGVRDLFPSVADTPEIAWLETRFGALHRALPEQVVREGGIGKVARTLAGVLTIGAYDTMEVPPVERDAHLRRILVGAYTYGAVYAIVDDTLHDMATYGPAADRERAHQLIEQTFASGRRIDFADVPDHPLAEELYMLYEKMVEQYPRADATALYDAAHSMYRAQHRDARRRLDMPAPLGELYPDIFAKAGLSRVVANLLGRRRVDDGFITRCLNTTFLSQFNDDLRDRHDDAAGNRLTTFTAPRFDGDPNPLYDLFAYDAYVVDEIHGGSPAAEEALAYFGAAKIARKLAEGNGDTAALVRKYDAPAEIERFLTLASRALPTSVDVMLRTADTALKEETGVATAERDQSTLDVRTFVLDRMDFIDDVIGRLILNERDGAGGEPIDAVYHYMIGGTAKRVRPALTLMLAEALDVPYARTEPLLAASELFHTASLILDDLPAQDDSPERRGRPSAHVAFGEATAQITAVAMVSDAFAMLARTRAEFPIDRVGDLVAYAGRTLGPERLCRGQLRDIAAARDGRELGVDELLELYRLKTSSLIEGALLPLLILLGRDEQELRQVATYADHAGIVFQLRDDLLDAAEGGGATAVNIVSIHGRAVTYRLLDEHRQLALDACGALPYDTRLLENAVSYFANRKR